MLKFLKHTIIIYFVFVGSIFGATYLVSMLPLPDPPTNARE